MEFEDVCMRLSLILHDDWIWKLYERNEDVHLKMAEHLLPSMMEVNDNHRSAVKLINMIMVVGDEELSWDYHDKMMVKHFIDCYRDQWPLSRKILDKFLKKHYE